MSVNIIKIILLFCLYSKFIAQSSDAEIPSILGEWTTGWQNNASTCCIPSSVLFSINDTSENYILAYYSYPPGYAANNAFCQGMNITGNFQDNLMIFEWLYFLNVIVSTSWGDLITTPDASTYYNYYLVNLGIARPMVTDYTGLYLAANDGCEIYLIPSGNITGNQSIYISEFNKLTFDAPPYTFGCGFESTLPNSTTLNLEQNSTNMTLIYTFGSDPTVFISQNASIIAYGINMTTWLDNNYNFVIILNLSAPDVIQVGPNTYPDSLCGNNFITYTINNNTNSSNDSSNFVKWMNVIMLSFIIMFTY